MPKKKAAKKNKKAEPPKKEQYILCPFTDEKVYIVPYKLSQLTSKQKSSNRRELVYLFSKQTREEVYTHTACALQEKETELLPFYGQRPWNVTVKVSESSSKKKQQKSPLFRWYRGQLELAVLPHFLERIPDAPNKRLLQYSGKTQRESQQVRNEEWETHAKSTDLQERQVSMLSQVAWNCEEYAIPTVTLKWMSPNKERTFYSRKAAWDYAYGTLLKNQVFCDRVLRGFGARGQELQPFKPTRAQALKAGKIRFLRDGLWVVGQEESWQEERFKQMEEEMEEEESEEEQVEEQEDSAEKENTGNGDETQQHPPAKKPRRITGMQYFVKCHREEYRQNKLKELEEQAAKEAEKEKKNSTDLQNHPTTMQQKDASSDLAQAAQDGASSTQVSQPSLQSTGPSNSDTASSQASAVDTSRLSSDQPTAAGISQPSSDQHTVAGISRVASVQPSAAAGISLPVASWNSGVVPPHAAAQSCLMNQSDRTAQSRAALMAAGPNNNVLLDQRHPFMVQQMAMAAMDQPLLVQALNPRNHHYALQMNSGLSSSSSPLRAAAQKATGFARHLLGWPVSQPSTQAPDPQPAAHLAKKQPPQPAQQSAEHSNQQPSASSSPDEQKPRAQLPAANLPPEEQKPRAQPATSAKGSTEAPVSLSPNKQVTESHSVQQQAKGLNSMPSAIISPKEHVHSSESTTLPVVKQPSSASSSSNPHPVVIIPSKKPKIRYTLADADKELKLKWRTLDEKDKEEWSAKAKVYQDSLPDEPVRPANSQPKKRSFSPLECYIRHVRVSYRNKKLAKLKAEAAAASTDTANEGEASSAVGDKDPIRFTLKDAEHELRREWKTLPEEIHNKWKEVAEKERKEEERKNTHESAAVGTNVEAAVDVEGCSKEAPVSVSATLSPTRIVEITTASGESLPTAFEEKRHAESTTAAGDSCNASRVTPSPPLEPPTNDIAVCKSTEVSSDAKEESGTKAKETKPVIKRKRGSVERIKNSLTPSVHWRLGQAQMELCHKAIMEHYDKVMHTVKAKALHAELADGFDLLRERGRGRYDMELPVFDTPEFSFLTDLQNASWMPIVREILGQDVILIHKGAFLSMPGSEPQVYHQDGPHLTEKYQKPCHAINVFIPLVDLTNRNGPTEFCLGTHILGHEEFVKERAETPLAKAGTPVIFDYRLGHRGLGNSSGSCRPIVYCTYAAAANGKEFRDSVNFSRKRYHKIGDLLALPLSREERAERRRSTTAQQGE